MRFLIDQNVPDSLAQLLRDRSHNVVLVRDTLGRASPDQLIALTAAREGLIVVTLDKDFRRFRQQAHRERQQAFAAGAGLLHIATKETLALTRLSDEIMMIEAYAARASAAGKFLAFCFGSLQLSLRWKVAESSDRHIDRTDSIVHPPFLPHWLSIVATAVVLSLLLFLSVETVIGTESGPIMIAWAICWLIGGGVVGWYRRSWFWPVTCPVTMLAIVMLWEVVYGRTSWASTFVLALGIAYAVSAAIGALLGTWLGKRRGAG